MAAERNTSSKLMTARQDQHRAAVDRIQMTKRKNIYPHLEVEESAMHVAMVWLADACTASNIRIN